MKKITSSFEDKIIVLDNKQMAIAKTLPYGQYIFRGAGGTGKTTLLIGRAKYLSENHKDFKILVVCNSHRVEKNLQDNLSMYTNIYIYKYKDISALAMNDEFKYNALLIDELQDINETTILELKSLLIDSQNSHFIGFLDGGQNTFHNSYNLDFVDKVEELDNNYRNSNDIND